MEALRLSCEERKRKFFYVQKESKRHEKVAGKFIVDWLHEKKSDVKEKEKNFGKFALLRKKTREGKLVKNF